MAPLLRLFLLFCSSLVALLAASQPPQRMRHHIDESQTFRLAGQVRPAVALSQDLGAVPDSLVLSGLSIHFSLTAVQQSDLTQLQAELQDPNSGQFHKFLTPEQYAARFGLNKADLDKVTEWLEQSGFSSVRVSRSRNWVDFSGTAAQVQSAFHTPLHRYSYGGQEHFANVTDLLLCYPKRCKA